MSDIVSNQETGLGCLYNINNNIIFCLLEIKVVMI